MAEVLEVSRLVSLTGAPGIGKTRLALVVAEGQPDPAVVVELAPVAHPALVPKALACALSIQEGSGQDLVETILAKLRRRRMLLVLDNCEHLLAACAQIVDELLAGCTEVRVLATSREPLGLEYERVWWVPPLPVPELVDDADPDALICSPAVALFVERAGEVQPGFALNSFVASDVAEICRRLDGIPLAIELAAARVGVLTPGEIAGRLADRLSLLGGGRPSPLSRHETLAAALDWSHALLSAPERVLLRRLSVFAGRFEPGPAETLCAGPEVDPPGISVLLVRLASKSLLVAETAAVRSGQVRYRMLETIRSYAGEKLEQAGEASDLRTAHAQFYLSLAERAEPELTGPDQDRWLEHLETERANLRAALEWSLGHGDTGLALRLAGALVLFWRVRCHFGEGRDLLDAVLSASGEEPPALRAKALWGAGFLRFMAGDPAGAIPTLEESLACFRELRDRKGTARALLILANARQHNSDPRVLALLDESARLAGGVGDSWCQAHALGVAGFECARRDELRHARRMLEECLSVARAAGEQQSLRIGMLGLGQVAVAQGDYPEAQSLLDEAVHITRALGEDMGRATALRYLGKLALGRGDFARARELFDEAMALIAEIAPPEARLESLALLASVAHAQGDRRRARYLLDEVCAGGGRGAFVLLALGRLAVDEGDSGEGRRLFEAAREKAQTQGKPGQIAEALHGLGQLARGEGDGERAAALHGEALTLRDQAGELPAIADSLEAVAGLVAAAGQHERAARLFGAATALRHRGGYARPPWESARYKADTVLCASLPAGELRSAYAQGEALSLEQAIAEASKSLRRTSCARGWPSLTNREHQVVELVAEGLTNLEIAAHMVISLETVKTHVSRIFFKLGVTGRRELARAARSRNGQPR